MPRDHDIEAREQAERRVREMQARQMARLLEWQDQERRKDFRIQKQALDQNAQREAALIETQRLATERLEREWQQQRDRLGHMPGPAPAFGMAAPAQRDLSADYERLRQHYLRTRQALEQRFAEDRAACQRERAEQLQEFQNANLARERGFEEDRARKEEDQKLGFEILVHRQMQRSEKSVGQEFTRASRPPEREI